MVKDSNVLYLKSQHLQIPYIEQWKEIVATTHLQLTHVGLQETVSAFRSIWSKDLHSHGLSTYYVKGGCVVACDCQGRYQGRMFFHGYVYTTNIVGTHWQYIKHA